MPADFDSGFFVRQPAWHGLGTVVDTPPETWEEARILAGLDWDPIKQPVFAKDIGITEQGEPYEKYEEIPGWNRVVRSDTAETLYIGPESYTLITHGDMGLIMDAIMGEEQRHWETGGSLEGGKKVWCLVELGDPIQIGGDPSATKRYVVILNSHDGQTSCKAIATLVRVVCGNTWHAAEVDGARSESCYTFTHTAQWKKKLELVGQEARAAIAGASEQVEAYRLIAEDLAAKPVTRSQELRFVDEFIFPTSKEHELKPRALENVRAARTDLFGCLDSPTCEGIRGTAYGLVQAGGEWADHVRPFQDRETLFGRSVMRVDTYKKRGHKLALAAAAGTL